MLPGRHSQTCTDWDGPSLRIANDLPPSPHLVCVCTFDQIPGALNATIQEP